MTQISLIVDVNSKSLSLHVFIHAVPATPIPDVCAVYDIVNRTMQIIENMWNELVCMLGDPAIASTQDI